MTFRHGTVQIIRTTACLIIVWQRVERAARIYELITWVLTTPQSAQWADLIAFLKNCKVMLTGSFIVILLGQHLFRNTCFSHLAHSQPLDKVCKSAGMQSGVFAASSKQWVWAEANLVLAWFFQAHLICKTLQVLQQIWEDPKVLVQHFYHSPCLLSAAPRVQGHL